MQLAATMIAIISQVLLPRIDQGGRICAFEVMISTPAIANLIREGKTYQIFSELQTGAKYGSRTLDSHLFDLYSKGIISYDDALSKSYDPSLFMQQAGQLASTKKHPGMFAKK
jgi:twitching motility protein PilT